MLNSDHISGSLLSHNLSLISEIHCRNNDLPQCKKGDWHVPILQYYECKVFWAVVIFVPQWPRKPCVEDGSPMRLNGPGSTSLCVCLEESPRPPKLDFLRKKKKMYVNTKLLEVFRVCLLPHFTVPNIFYWNILDINLLVSDIQHNDLVFVHIVKQSPNESC